MVAASEGGGRHLQGPDVRDQLVRPHVYHKPSYIVEKDGRVVQVDTYGNKQLHKPQYRSVDGKVYATTAYGRVRRRRV